MNQSNDLQVENQEHAIVEPNAPQAGEPDAARLGTPKALFWNRPIVSDWAFWFAIVFATLGGSQSIYRTGQGYAESYAGLPDGMLIYGGLIDIVFTAVLAPLVVAVVPAFFRFLIRRATLKRQLAVLPEDRAAGWKADPVDKSQLRWWSESGWTQATNPPKSRKIGVAGMLVYGAMVLVIVAAFFAGYSSSPSSTPGQSSVGQSSSEPKPNASLAADVYFADLMASEPSQSDRTSFKSAASDEKHPPRAATRE